MARSKQNQQSLTAPELDFASRVARGEVSQAECFRQAFPDKIQWTARAIAVEASKLAKRPDIALMVAQLRESATEAAKDDLKAHKARLRELQELALQRDENGKPTAIGAAVKAEELIGKASGLYETRIRDVTQDNVAEAESYVESLITSDDPLDRAYGRKKAGEWGFPHLVEKADQIDAQPEEAEEGQGATVQ